MSIYYSAERNGFYAYSLKAEYYNSVEGWPDDALKISNAEYERLIRGRNNGKEIVADSNGYPTLIDPVIDWQACAENQRQSLLTEATAATSDFRTELQLGIISDEDKTALIRWMEYIKEIRALELSCICDEDDYKSINWPKVP